MKLFINANIPTSSAALKRVNVLFDQKIIKVSKDPIEAEEAVEVIDLDGMLLLPGAVDIHCHIMSKLADYPKHLEAVTKTAISGGWTTLADMSYMTDTPIFDKSALAKRIPIVDANTYCDITLWGHVDIEDYPYHSEAAQELWAKGMVGLILMNPSPNPQVSDISYTEIMDLFLDIYDSDTAFAYQGWDVEESKGFGRESQTAAVKKLLRRMQENPIHIPRVTFFELIDFINGVSKRSDISFSLCMADVMNLMAGISRPDALDMDLEEQMELMLELFRTNKIYLLSNNASYLPSETDTPDIFAGIDYQRMEYSYLWVLSELWKKQKLPLHSCIKMTSENPAKRLGIYPQKGSLDPGSDADFVIYNPEGITQTNLKTDAGDTVELSGSINAVYLKGDVVYSGKTHHEKTGRFLARSHSPKRRHNKTTWI